MTKTLFACLLLASFCLATLPAAYGTLFEVLRKNEVMPGKTFRATYQVRWALERPGRLLLLPTPYDGALVSTHVPFWPGFWALIFANWCAWLGLLLGITWLVRRFVVKD